MHIHLRITNRWTVFLSHTCCACLPVRVIDVCLTKCPSDRCVSLQFTNIMCLATCLSNRCVSLRVRCVSLFHKHYVSGYLSESQIASL